MTVSIHQATRRIGYATQSGFIAFVASEAHRFETREEAERVGAECCRRMAVAWGGEFEWRVRG